MSKRKSVSTISPPAERQPQKAGARRSPSGASSRRPKGRWGIALLALVALGAGLFAAAHRGHRPARAVSAAAPAPTLPPAEAALRSALAARPNEPAPHEALARYLLGERRPFEALWHFRALQDLQPNDPDARAGIARALTQAGLPAVAIQVLNASAPNSNSSTSTSTSTNRPARNTDSAIRNTEYALARAEAALATARPAAALLALGAAGTALDHSAPAQLMLGDARFAAGDVPGAQAAYRRAIALDPQSAASYDRLGRLALAAGQWAAATKALAAARARLPQAPGPLYRLGLAAAGVGDMAAAERLWQEAVAVAPAYAPAHAALGRLYQNRKEGQLAATHLTAAVKMDPSSEAQLALADLMSAHGDRALACYQRGFYDLETDRPQLALAEFHRMTATAPELVDGPLIASLADIQIKRLDRAAIEARKGLEHHPNDPRLLGRLAMLEVLGGDLPRAKQLCAGWVKSDPHAAEPYRILCRIARDEQRLPEAVQDGEKALARDPRNAEACHELSRALSALPGPQNQRRALDLAQQAVALDPRAADDWHQLGVLLRSAGQVEEAAGAFLHSLDLNPAAADSCSLLVQIAAQERRPETSRFFAELVPVLKERSQTGELRWRDVYSHPEDATAHARLARYLLSTGDLRRARYQLQQVVALRPADAAARVDLAIVERLRRLREE